MNNTKTSRVKVNQDVNGLNNLKKGSIESLQKYTMQESKKQKQTMTAH